MATKPSLPDDEQPLDAATVDLLLSNIGTDMILVGGQALAFWMDRFGVDANGAAISNDGDALGELATARALAAAISARLVVPRKTARTSVIAQLRLPTAGGCAPWRDGRPAGRCMPPSTARSFYRIGWVCSAPWRAAERVHGASRRPAGDEANVNSIRSIVGRRHQRVDSAPRLIR